MRLAAIAIAALALSTTAQAAPAERGSVEHGRQLVTRNCAGCHAVGPRGDSPNPLSPPFREL